MALTASPSGRLREDSFQLWSPVGLFGTRQSDFSRQHTAIRYYGSRDIRAALKPMLS